MIVLGPFVASIGTQIIQTPTSADVTAIGILNASQFFLTAKQAGTYANMAVPPYTADVFLSPYDASQSISVSFTNLSNNNPVYAVSSYAIFYIYLYGSNDPISRAINSGVATGYPYSLAGLHDPSRYVSTISGNNPNQVTKNINISYDSGAKHITLTVFDAYLWGFDATFTQNTSTSAFGQVTITDVVASGNTPKWSIAALASVEIPPLNIRFPFPLPIMGQQAANPDGFGGYQCTIDIPQLGNSTTSLVVYSSQ